MGGHLRQFEELVASCMEKAFSVWYFEGFCETSWFILKRFSTENLNSFVTMDMIREHIVKTPAHMRQPKDRQDQETST